MCWADDELHVIESRAVMLGLIGRPPGPDLLEDVDPRVYVAFLEGLIRESEEGSKELDELYFAPANPSAPMSREDEIAAFLALAD